MCARLPKRWPHIPSMARPGCCASFVFCLFPVVNHDLSYLIQLGLFDLHLFHQLSSTMHRFFGLTLQCKRPIRSEPPDGSHTDELPLPYVMAGPPHAQRQCVLFNVISSEIRLLIFEAALSDPVRLLHVVPYRGKQRRKTMGHWRCVDK
jgi:hypothetical protein